MIDDVFPSPVSSGPHCTKANLQRSKSRCRKDRFHEFSDLFLLYNVERIIFPDHLLDMRHFHLHFKGLWAIQNFTENSFIFCLCLCLCLCVVIMDRSDYDSGVLKIISASGKFKPLKEDPTLLRESQLQRFLRKLKTNGHLEPKVYSKNLPLRLQASKDLWTTKNAQAAWT